MSIIAPFLGGGAADDRGIAGITLDVGGGGLQAVCTSTLLLA